MVTKDPSIEILKGIRDEGRQTNRRLDETNKRLDESNVRLEQLREDVTRRIVESEVRTATAITALAGNVQELTSFLRASAELKPRVERCEEEIAALKRRLPA